MPSSIKKKFYAVAKGKNPGIYLTWAEAKEQVNGFSKAVFKSFPTKIDAENFMKKNGTFSISSYSAEQTKVHSNNDRLDKEKDDISIMNSHQDHSERTTVQGKSSPFRIEMYCDGGSRGNPGIAGAGCIIQIYDKESNSIIESIQIRKYVGMNATNNVAEYEGLLIGISEFVQWLKQKNNDNKKLELGIKCDSKLIVQQMNGVYRCESKNIRHLYDAARVKLDYCVRKGVDVTISHIYREANTVADGLANEAMDQRRSWVTRNVLDTREDQELVVTGNKTKPYKRSVDDNCQKGSSPCKIKKNSNYEYADV